MSSKNQSVLDTTTGPLLRPLISFSVPIMLSNILQLLFNAADIVVVGQFINENAVASIGCTALIINMVISLFSGLAIGPTIIISNNVGSGKNDHHSVIHTAYSLGIILGIVSLVTGLVIAKPFLMLLQTPADIIDQSTLYLKIYFLGQPGFMIYTFARSILVAKGDTQSPFRYLAISGVANIILNLFFVAILHHGVESVAIATIASQYLSGILTTRKLLVSNDEFRLDLRKLQIDSDITKKIIRIGLPAGLQSTLMSLSAVFTQSAVNSLGTEVIAGQSAANSIWSFVSQTINAFSQGCMTFVSQNFASGKQNRVRKTFRCTLLIGLIFGIGLGAIVLGAGRSLLKIYVPDSQIAIETGMIHFYATIIFAFLLGFQDASCFLLRGLDCSLFPMITSIFGNCVFRIGWVILVFNRFAPGMETLDAYKLLVSSYPISWLIIFLANITAYAVILKKQENSVCN